MTEQKDGTGWSRREWLAGAGAGVAAALLANRTSEAQTSEARTVVFTHTTVVNVDVVQRDVALAVTGNTIAAIGPTDDIVRRFPRAEVYDGRGKAILPGLINCHSHLTATIERGFNEDFGFPNAARLSQQPGSLLSDEETTLMATVGALEGLRSGSTTIVQSASNIAVPSACSVTAGCLRPIR